MSKEDTPGANAQNTTALSRRRFLQVAGASLVVASGGGIAHFSMSTAHAQGAFKLNVLHINDMHSRVESISRFNSTCSAEDQGEGKCFGGFGRLATKIWERRKALEDAGENVVTLDAGDQFQGSLFYTTYKGKVEGEFMNKIGFDLMAVGNHEFDNGPDVLADFADLIEFPLISGNITIADTEKLHGKVDEWAILDVGGEKIGVLSVLTPDTVNIASPGPGVTFQDDIEYLKEAVTRIRAEGVTKVLLLSHVGFNRDQEIAAQVEGISAIIGGHSHTLLSNTEEGAPSYAMLVENPAGKAVPIVQAGAYSKHLGDIALTFDEEGYVAEATGDTLLLDASVEPDAEIEARIAELAGPIETMKATEVGEVAAPIDGSRETCRAKECEMGVLVTDAILARTADLGVTIAIQNGGGLRASIDQGMATVGDVLSVLPFQNTLATMKLKGADIVGSLEAAVNDIENGAGKFPQVGGLKFTLDLNVDPDGGRVKDVMVQENGEWVPIDPEKEYTVGTNDFMRKGGDGYALFASNAVDPYDYGPGMEEVVAEYLANNAPYQPKLEGRITVIEKN
ncbi:multifunctional 2',3'-cyclic-nucleotide 2'-phosphodiesterase/5'-nucleotidase/3'-nucleotidase [Mesorhizobium microcysteis]|uniref:Multifunctional 2',3'-cyclic-nucleotide 2'-phosphodiesterase/5'-nucleotidase/3'-nucleotidase n=1 Tax=Neoaquamicrobium microcysteis TaxID=2682781 RepID=A0A5D4GM68_9HYPH|nr:5'-nucleotidase C-terminal domain-containing protein [Mesorhizobium microcysteis]TYR29418.1 multifunctional 2',3'-cyclic-nucleotide 2'-phosphodiesterase/5'-nucleotidase/3'-nucleotidase [Mesorhizobium microcysteis]